MTAIVELIRIFQPNQTTFIYGLSGFISVLLAVYILFKNHRSILNLSYALVAGFYGIGVIAAYFYLAIPKRILPDHQALYYFFFRTARSLFSLRQSTLYLFTIATLGLDNVMRRKIWVYLNFGIGALLTVLFIALPRPAVAIVVGKSWFTGNLNDAYLVYSICMTIYILVTYVFALRSSENAVENNKFGLLAFATGLYSLVLPLTYVPAMRLWFGTSLLSVIGSCQFLWLLICAYVIVRYKLLDLQVLALKSSVWVLASVLVILPFAIAFRLIHSWLIASNASFSTHVSLSMVLLYFFLAYAAWLQPKIDYLFQKRSYDLRALLASYLSELANLKSLEAVQSQLETILSEQLFAESVSLYVRDETGKSYLPVMTHGDKVNPSPVWREEPVLLWLSKFHELMSSQDVSERYHLDHDSGDSLKLFFNLHPDWRLWVPMHDQSGLVGWITLGPKMAGEEYKGVELEFLDQLRKGLAVALSNSLLFDEVRQFGVRMETTVQERTRELAGANERLKELDRIKNDFFSNVSHELRTPLTLIQGPIDNLLDGKHGQLGDQQRKSLETIHVNAFKLGKLVDELLDFARMDAGKMKVRWQRKDVAAFFRLLASQIESAAHSKSIQIQVKVPKQKVEIFCDPEKLETIALNLLSNALKYTAAEGRISVTVEDYPKTVRIAVEDTGIGISKENLPRLFQRFQRLEGTEFAFKGTGIGLAFTKELVELQGGRIWADSELGKGSVFFVELNKGTTHIPAGDALDGESSEDFKLSEAERLLIEKSIHGNRRSPNGDQKGETEVGSDKPLLLLVEDNHEMSDYVRGVLNADYRVATAADGEEGLSKASELKPALIVSDVMMPKLGGEELCRRIKDDEKLRHIPVVLLTARGGQEQRIHGFESGADGYIVKPFNPRELSVRIQSLLKLTALQRELQVANERLKQLDVAKTEFMSVLRHELNNPIGSIKMYAETLRKRPERVTEEKKAQYLEFIGEESARLGRLVRDLLDMTEIELGRFKLRLEPMKISPLLAKVADSFRMQFPDLRFPVASPEPDVELPADADKIEEVLINLVGNAVKYSPSNGEIRISAQREKDAILLSVADQGPGISAQHLEKVFDKFYRIESETGAKGPSGTGLGLTISKKIVEMHGGRIWIESEIGKGSRFYFRLPFSAS